MPLDAKQLATLIENHAGALRLWIRSRCASGDDVVQEAFCRLAVQDPPPDNPAAWLYRVCRNLAARQRRSDNRRVLRERRRAVPEQVGADPAEALEMAEMIEAVEALDDEHRDVVIARIWSQLSLEEIGDLCGISTATAFRRYQAALETLRLKLNANCENQR